jgi:glutamate-1-semialdehyde 2,1-aminomutase
VTPTSDSPASPLRAAAQALTEAERARFVAARPRSANFAAARVETGRGFLGGVPLHWMLDWPMPFLPTIAAAEGATLTDADGHAIVDFCLGDTGAMFGHRPAAIAAAVAAAPGYTTMLPSYASGRAGVLLAELFGLPWWQMTTTASDANRFALRVARAVTGRRAILVYDGCYHGAVDESFVDIVDGRTVARPALLGQGADPTGLAEAVPFNDLAALEAALATGRFACVLAEPAMTNCSMILPDPGYHAALRRLTRETGTLLVIDETHTLSTGLGGYTRVHGLEPDMLVAGKAIAGGVPTAVWGMTQAVADRLAAADAARTPGHSGIGTTLSGSPLQVAALLAALDLVMTPAAYAHMTGLAATLASGIADTVAALGLPWSVARLGARLEIVGRPQGLRNADDARAAYDPVVEGYLHLALLNRGFLLTPFHNMMLCSPAHTEAQAKDFLAAFRDAATLLARRAAA